MSKWYGIIGYAEHVETTPGDWDEIITERSYFGDVYKNARMLQTTNVGTNDNVNVSTQISIVADPYSLNKFHTMRYAEFMGNKWKITNVDVQYPRLVLTIGGLYNGDEA
jgi:hypothetical protein